MRILLPLGQRIYRHGGTLVAVSTGWCDGPDINNFRLAASGEARHWRRRLGTDGKVVRK